MAVLVSKYLLNNLSGQEVRLRASDRRQGRWLAKSHTGSRSCLRPASHWGEGPGALY